MQALRQSPRAHSALSAHIRTVLGGGGQRAARLPPGAMWAGRNTERLPRAHGLALFAFSQSSLPGSGVMQRVQSIARRGLSWAEDVPSVEPSGPGGRYQPRFSTVLLAWMIAHAQGLPVTTSPAS